MDTNDPIEELLQELRKHLTVNPAVRIVFDRDEEVLSAVLEEIQEIADLVYASDDDPRFKIGTDELLGDLLVFSAQARSIKFDKMYKLCAGLEHADSFDVGVLTSGRIELTAGYKGVFVDPHEEPIGGGDDHE